MHGKWPIDNIDHINNITSDNRICNLREATSSQNQANSPIQKNNTTGYKGVSVEGIKYKATIQVNKKSITIGRFSSAEEAAIAYDIKAIEVFGTFAYTNF